MFKLMGKKPDYVMAKDIILKIIGDVGTDGANYKTMQFSGSAIKQLGMDERLTLTNMTTEAGAKNGIIEPDTITDAYLRKRTDTQYFPVLGDIDAEFSETHTYEIDKLEPIVAKPFSPGNVSAARELQGVEVDKAYIGSCTGAKLQDLRLAAKRTERQESKDKDRSVTSRSINFHGGYARRSAERFLRGRRSSWTSYLWSLLRSSHGRTWQE